jgi:hypothetical protein
VTDEFGNLFGEPLPQPTSREPDLPFEALAEATSTDWDAGRGELNKALAVIRAQFAGTDEELAAEILERAKLYRRIFQGASLTPPALAKHWRRVFEEAVKQREQQATNQSTPWRQCGTCGGDRFVVVGTRPMESHWMRERGLKSRGAIEEMAACPQCAAALDTSFRRYDGTMSRALDPARVRDLMSS